MLKYAQRILFVLISAGVLYAISHVLLIADVERSIDSLEESEIFALEELQLLQENNDSLQLALVGIDIVQGSKSTEEWKLNANWANYSADTGSITVDMPYIEFFGKDKKQTSKPNQDNTITAKGKTGMLVNDKTLVLLRDDVVLNQGTVQIDTALVEYNTIKKVFIFSESALITSPDMQGSADFIEWDTVENRIQAKENVVFIFNDTKNLYSIE